MLFCKNIKTKKNNFSRNIVFKSNYQIWNQVLSILYDFSVLLNPESSTHVSLVNDFIKLHTQKMLCSRVEFSFRTVYVSILVGTKQLHVYTQTWFKKFRLETPFLDDKVISKEKRQNFKICKPISLSIFIFVFNNFFVFSLFWSLNNHFIMVLAPAYDQKCPLRIWERRRYNLCIWRDGVPRHFRPPLLIQMFINVASSTRLSGIGMSPRFSDLICWRCRGLCC